jgi:hypothetical protein
MMSTEMGARGLIATALTAVATAATLFPACSPGPTAADGTAYHSHSMQEHVPKNSTGRRPAGTRADPFVGDGVIARIFEPDATGLVRIVFKQRAIPYFTQANESSGNLPVAVVRGISEGDFVRFYYAKLVPGSPAEQAYTAALRRGDTTSPGAIVYFGYELYRMTVIPDDEYVSERRRESLGAKD